MSNCRTTTARGPSAAMAEGRKILVGFGRASFFCCCASCSTAAARTAATRSETKILLRRSTAARKLSIRAAITPSRASLQGRRAFCDERSFVSLARADRDRSGQGSIGATVPLALPCEFFAWQQETDTVVLEIASLQDAFTDIFEVMQELASGNRIVSPGRRSAPRLGDVTVQAQQR